MIADFLADREGLSGKPRERFKRLLREDYGVDAAPHALDRAPDLLAGFSVLAAVATLPLAESRMASVILGSAILFILAMRFFLNRRPSSSQSPKAEWAVYCQLIRPFILVRHPGLLDRNREGCIPPDPAFLDRALRRSNVLSILTPRDVFTCLLVGLLVSLAFPLLPTETRWMIAPVASILVLTGLAGILVWRSYAAQWVRRQLSNL